MYSLAMEVFRRTNSFGTQYKRHTVLKFILTDSFFFFDLGSHMSRLSVPPPKLHPFAKKENPMHTVLDFNFPVFSLNEC